jgi:hypothetical protein
MFRPEESRMQSAKTGLVTKSNISRVLLCIVVSIHFCKLIVRRNFTLFWSFQLVSWIDGSDYNGAIIEQFVFMTIGT